MCLWGLCGKLYLENVDFEGLEKSHIQMLIRQIKMKFWRSQDRSKLQPRVCIHQLGGAS